MSRASGRWLEGLPEKNSENAIIPAMCRAIHLHQTQRERERGTTIRSVTMRETGCELAIVYIISQYESGGRGIKSHLRLLKRFFINSIPSPLPLPPHQALSTLDTVSCLIPYSLWYTSTHVYCILYTIHYTLYTILHMCTVHCTTDREVLVGSLRAAVRRVSTSRPLS